ncbi:MAG: hypothetical protein ACC707_19635 [Thiohalomonadales bacterium]
MFSAYFAFFSSILVIALVFSIVRRYSPSANAQYVVLGFFAAFFVLTSWLGITGVLADFSTLPPKFFLLFPLELVACLVLVLTKTGKTLVTTIPLKVLVVLQGFRVLPELLLHFAYLDGLAPVQMTFHGRNWDIVTALTAIVLFLVWDRVNKPQLLGWLHSILGIGLLLNIIAIAILSAPTPLRVFMNEPANTFVTTFPYILLPGIHVLAAIFLHMLTIRKLISLKQTKQERSREII